MPKETFEQLIAANGGKTFASLFDFMPGVKDRFQTHQGKTGDTVDFGNGIRLIVRSDRISTFDVVHPTLIPYKGIVLTQLSIGWFQKTLDIVPNHFLTGDVEDFLEPFKGIDELRGRAMLVRSLDMIPFECVVRGYLAGSALTEYKERGEVCGITLPTGLRESDELPKLIFTPATKEKSGHDINVSFDHMAENIGAPLATRLKKLSLAIYNFAAIFALEQGGIRIADTKFEFGRERLIGASAERHKDIIYQGSKAFVVCLGDEVLTPDSSRFWPNEWYEPGKPTPSLDKQYVRDYVTAIKWNKQPPAPTLPEEVIINTSEKYLEAYRRVFGESAAVRYRL